MILLAAVNLAGTPVFAAPLCSQIFTEGGVRLEINDQDALGYQVLRHDLLTLNRFFMNHQNLKDLELIDLVLEKDLRVLFFRIESVMSLYSNKDSQFFKPLLEDFKQMEDLIGKVDLHQSLKKTADEKKIPELATYFQKKILQDRSAIQTALDHFNIRDEEKSDFKRIAKKLKKYEGWKSAKKDRKLLMKEMGTYVQELRKDIQNMKYDQPDIEKGLHELRRRVRWITIQIKSLDGLIHLESPAALSKKTGAWFSEMEKFNPNLLTSKYLAASTNDPAHTIAIPLKLYAMLNQIVSEIGARKDRSETEIYFKEAIAATGSKSSMESLQFEKVDHQQLARDYQNRINETDLLGAYLTQFQRINQLNP